MIGELTRLYQAALEEQRGNPDDIGLAAEVDRAWAALMDAWIGDVPDTIPPEWANSLRKSCADCGTLAEPHDHNEYGNLGGWTNRAAGWLCPKCA